jgi:hypothetical protein
VKRPVRQIEEDSEESRPAEVTIEDIYAGRRSTFQLSEQDVAALITCEIKLEIELCRRLVLGKSTEKFL